MVVLEPNLKSMRITSSRRSLARRDTCPSRKCELDRYKDIRTTKPSKWWREVKMIAGMAPASGVEEVRSHLHLDGIAAHSNLATANINQYIRGVQGSVRAESKKGRCP